MECILIKDLPEDSHTKSAGTFIGSFGGLIDPQTQLHISVYIVAALMFLAGLLCIAACEYNSNFWIFVIFTMCIGIAANAVCTLGYIENTTDRLLIKRPTILNNNEKYTVESPADTRHSICLSWVCVFLFALLFGYSFSYSTASGVGFCVIFVLGMYYQYRVGRAQCKLIDELTSNDPPVEPNVIK
jgi:hypothetical protein